MRRLGRLRLAPVRLLVVGALALTTLAVNPPAALAAPTCWDQIKDNPTPVRSGPGSGYPVIEWKYPGQQVTGPCAVVFNTTDNHLWYVAHYHLGGYVYIWVGHLNYFSRTGNCYPILCGVYYTSGPPPPIPV